MPDQVPLPDIGAIWKGQPTELAITQDELLNRWGSRLSAATRSEILTSAGAPFLLVVLLEVRPDALEDPVILLSFVCIALWVAATIYWHRKQIWKRNAELASPGIDFYRAELHRRRAHLRNLWLWHGPAALAFLTFASVWIRKGVPSLRRLISIAPLLAVMVVWTVIGIRRRHRALVAIQEEIGK